MPPEALSASLPPAVLMVAPNGARRGKADHPALPITPAELAAEARACQEAGATVLHMHVRDEDGRHSLDPDRYLAATAAVRAEVGERMVVQITTEAVGMFGRGQQMATVRAVRPEAVSLGLRELVPDPDDPGEAAAFLAWLRQERIAPQYILYDPADVITFHGLIRRGVIPQQRPFALFVLGRYVGPGRTVHPGDLLAFLAAHDRALRWALCAFGVPETACLVTAMAMGGHPRVGFENSLWHADGSLAASNAERVARIAEGARLIGRPLADIEATRALLSATAA
jgi:3-keto-5-aminohexanoate cleavage enzyme